MRLDGVKHFVMTMGTINETDKGARYMARCVRGVKAVVDLPIEVQFEPPDDLEVLRRGQGGGCRLDRHPHRVVRPGRAGADPAGQGPHQRRLVLRDVPEGRRALRRGPGQQLRHRRARREHASRSSRAASDSSTSASSPSSSPSAPIVGSEMQDVPAPSAEVMTQHLPGRGGHARSSRHEPRRQQGRLRPLRGLQRPAGLRRGSRRRRSPVGRGPAPGRGRRVRRTSHGVGVRPRMIRSRVRIRFRTQPGRMEPHRPTDAGGMAPATITNVRPT